MTRRRPVLAAVVVALIALAGCTPAGDSHAGHGSSAAPASATGTPASGPHNDADVMFAQMMIPHHQQAVEMSDIVLGKDGVPAEVTALATQIKDAQAPEITQMAGWLVGWGEDPAGGEHMDHGSGHGGDDGMLTAQELDQLRNATGAAAAKLFLSGMIQHHEGAVTMAKTEQADGENPDAKALAAAIIRSQEAEITTMQKLLAAS